MVRATPKCWEATEAFCLRMPQPSESCPRTFSAHLWYNSWSTGPAPCRTTAAAPACGAAASVTAGQQLKSSSACMRCGNSSGSRPVVAVTATTCLPCFWRSQRVPCSAPCGVPRSKLLCARYSSWSARWLCGPALLAHTALRAQPPGSALWPLPACTRKAARAGGVLSVAVLLAGPLLAHTVPMLSAAQPLAHC